MVRKRSSDEYILKLLREIDIHLHDGLGHGILFSRLLFVMLESPLIWGFIIPHICRWCESWVAWSVHLSPSETK